MARHWRSVNGSVAVVMLTDPQMKLHRNRKCDALVRMVFETNFGTHHALLRELHLCRFEFRLVVVQRL